MKPLPFWSLKKVYHFRAEPPRLGHYMEYLPQAGPSKVFSSSPGLSSAEASLCRREAGDEEKLARGAWWDGERESFRLSDYRPFRLHSAPVSKHKKWGRGSGGRFHTNHCILSPQVSTWCFCLQECGKGLLLYFHGDTRWERASPVQHYFTRYTLFDWESIID